jgi:RimJ/RimL family protein N-acetyltransferase
VKLRVATEADIEFVMRTERLPGYERTVGQSSAEEHAAEMAQTSSRYLVGEENGEAVGFALLQTLDDPTGNIYLKRIVVSRQAEGIGPRMLAALQDWVFAMPEAHRLHLRYTAKNEPGRRAYARAGFTVEGVEREVYKAEDGSRVDAVHASILRQEWLARRRPV